MLAHCSCPCVVALDDSIVTDDSIPCPADTAVTALLKHAIRAARDRTRGNQALWIRAIEQAPSSCHTPRDATALLRSLLQHRRIADPEHSLSHLQCSQQQATPFPTFFVGRLRKATANTVASVDHSSVPLPPALVIAGHIVRRTTALLHYGGVTGGHNVILHNDDRYDDAIIRPGGAD